uniref:T-cell receptor T3 zeta chain n=1 Tax=Xiphophorus maculatus TaxID=8083 RepID=A0A3B5Q875_XIPMA
HTPTLNHTPTHTCELMKALDYSDPKLCYVLDGFLGLYGLIITGMFIKEKSLSRPTGDTYEPLMTDPERGRVSPDGLSSATRDTYDSLQMQPLPAR